MHSHYHVESQNESKRFVSKQVKNEKNFGHKLWMLSVFNKVVIPRTVTYGIDDYN